MRSLPRAVTDALRQLDDGEAVDAIDLALARLIAGLDAEHGAPDPGRARTVALTTALVSHARRDGHSALDLADYAGAPFPGETPRGLPPLPALDDWRRQLDASPTVGGPSESCPLVWDARGRAPVVAPVRDGRGARRPLARRPAGGGRQRADGRCAHGVRGSVSSA